MFCWLRGKKKLRFEAEKWKRGRRGDGQLRLKRHVLDPQRDFQTPPPVYDMPHPDLLKMKPSNHIGGWVGQTGSALRRLRRLPKWLLRSRCLCGWPGRRLAAFRKNLSGQSWKVTSARPLSWLEEIYEFTQSTTFHGVRFIFDIDNIFIRRMVWLSTILALFYPFIIVISDSWNGYTSGNTVDFREIKYESSLDFPAITICNHNLFRTSVAAKEDFYSALSDLFANQSALTNATREKFELGNVTDTMARLAHQMEDLVYSCRWQGKPCAEPAFRMLLSDQGVCYTFNGDAAAPLKTETAGPIYGLSLVLNVEQYEYMAGPSNTAAVRVIVHKASNVVDPLDNGIDVPPGYHASVGISEVKVQTEGGPNKCEEKKLRYWAERTYTAAACQRECESDLIDEVCACHRVQIPSHPAILANQTLRPCNLYDKQLCVDPAIAAFKARVSPVDFHCVTDCNQTCSSSTYNPVLSYSSLSRYNAERLLDDGAKIRAIRTAFQSAREYNARFNQKATASDQRLFEEIDKVLDDLALVSIAPDEAAVRRLGLDLLNVTCFTNARTIQADYRRFVEEGIQELKALQIFTLQRSLFLRSFRARMNQMKTNAYNSKTLLDRQLATGDSDQIDQLVQGIRAQRLEQAQLLGDIASQITERVGNIEAFVEENFYLRNMSSFNGNFEGLPKFEYEMKQCLGRLNSSMDRSAYRLVQQVESGVVTRSSASESFEAWAAVERRCEALLVDYFHLDRDIWLADFNREVDGIQLKALNSFRTFAAREAVLLRPDIPVSGAQGIRSDFRRFQRQFQTTELTKLELANQITGDDFVDKVEYLVNFLSLVNRFFFNADDAISRYLREFGGLNEAIPEVVRELFRKQHPVEFALYFEGNLYTRLEVGHCIENRTRAVLSELRKELQTAQTAFQRTWARLRSQLAEYKDNSILNADFVLTNFAQVDVFYRDMRLEEVNKQAQYTINDLISDLGGNCGLYFGASFLTLAEFIDLIIYTTFRKYLHNRHAYLQRHQLQTPSHFITSKIVS